MRFQHYTVPVQPFSSGAWKEGYALIGSKGGSGSAKSQGKSVAVSGRIACRAMNVLRHKSGEHILSLGGSDHPDDHVQLVIQSACDHACDVLPLRTVEAPTDYFASRHRSGKGIRPLGGCDHLDDIVQLMIYSNCENKRNALSFRTEERQRAIL